jgi:predicted nucleic acid-binding protein
MHLVDTNVLSELAKPKPAPAVVEWFSRQQAIALSVVSLEELAFGIARAPALRRSKLATWFEALLDSADGVYEVTAAIARASGELRAARASAGRPVAQADMLIAATALVHGLTVATRNAADFDGCGVVVVDPFA